MNPSKTTGSIVSNRVAILLLVLSATASASGCVAVAAGAAAGVAGVAYARGDLERSYPYPMDVVWEASLSALAEVEMEITSADKDQLTAEIKARSATGKRITIKLKSDGQVTDLDLRVNVFGDADLSETILVRIEAYLPGLPPKQPLLVVPDSRPALPEREVDSPGSDSVSPNDPTR